MSKSSNIQIPERLFRLLVAYHIEQIQNDEIESQITDALNAKLDRIERRLEYTEHLGRQKDTGVTPV